MRKQKRALCETEAWEVFDQAPFASVAMIDEEEHPYIVALSVVRDGNTLYYHCALEGKKLDCIKKHPHVCVSAVAQADVVPEKATVYYQSCVLEGISELVMDDEEKKLALRLLCERFTPTHMDCALHITKQGLDATAIVKIQVTSIEGKCNPIKA